MLRLLLVLFLQLPLSVLAGAAEVSVFAAASLSDALQEIATAYETRSGDRIALNLGASNVLARQIEQGAPAELFLSADEAKMDALAKQNLIDQATRVSILSNTLVVIVPARGGQPLTHPRQLTEPRFARIALAEPSSVPAGIYARTCLQKYGVWTRIAAKVIPTANVRSALAAVATGNVDAAIVYSTDARAEKRVRIAYEVPRADGPRISYPFAALRGASRNARKFLAHLQSAEARAVFARHGFVEWTVAR
ncbi:MAG TPA: molybdate ABC transporter substrate-binding protein [Thermoanaerobaculia bacterium]|jgi:molybdate transport system substrate-binding protein